MRKVMEPGFEILYLLIGLVISIYILVKAKKKKEYILFGVMGLTLVFGDAFHLIPRIIHTWEIEVSDIYAMLGIGKLITSITMTIFYVILYWFFKLRYKKKTPLYLDIIIYILSIIRIVLCVLPANDWTSPNAPYMWGIYRNIPFVILGGIMVYLTYVWTREYRDRSFRYAFLAISLSFIFYIMTVTLAAVNELFGMMMLPKTVCYVWILVMGIMALKGEKKTILEE